MLRNGVLLLLVYCAGQLLPGRAARAGPVLQDTARAPSIHTVLTAGRAHFVFEYADPTRGFVYTFDSGATVLTLASEGPTFTRISVSYAKQAADTVSGQPVLNMIDIATELGGNVYLAGEGGRERISAYLPVRLYGGYRNIAPDHPEVGGPAERHIVHFLYGAFGGGIGGRFRLLDDFFGLGSGLDVGASVTRAFGLNTDFGRDAEGYGLAQVGEFTLQLQLDRLRGSRLGLTAGFLRRSLRWSTSTPQSFYTVLDAALRGEHLDASSTRNLFFVGVSW